MILKSIYLYIGEPHLDSEYTYAFTKSSRFICNWLAREVLKPLRFRTDGFKRIVVNLVSAQQPETSINSCQVAVVDLFFDRPRIDAAAGVALANLQISLLREGIEKCARTHAIPKAELLVGLNAFVAQGMRNQWLHKKWTFRPEALTATLSCEMTQAAFSLRLVVAHRKQVVFDAVILKTDPDEIAYDGAFKDIKIIDGCLVVVGRFDRPLWQQPLASLAASG